MEFTWCNDTGCTGAIDTDRGGKALGWCGTCDILHGCALILEADRRDDASIRGIGRATASAWNRWVHARTICQTNGIGRKARRIRWFGIGTIDEGCTGTQPTNASGTGIRF